MDYNSYQALGRAYDLVDNPQQALNMLLKIQSDNAAKDDHVKQVRSATSFESSPPSDLSTTFPSFTAVSGAWARANICLF
jgi:hypothetical protein